MNPIPDQPREIWVIKKARAFIKQARICWLPVKPFEICEKFGWEVLTAGQVAKRAGIPHQAVLSGKDSDVWYCNGQYKIVYNERAYPVRIPYSIAHEIGHIVLNHLVDFEQTRLSRGGLTDAEYWVLEREAEIFAAELLMPLPILRALKVFKIEEIMAACKVSRTTAKIRSEEIRLSFKYDQLDDDSWMKQQFGLYLHKVPVCTNGADRLTVKSRSLDLGAVNVAEEKLRYVTTDGRGRFTVCPTCGNTLFSDHASYCRMCGMYLYNNCTSVEEDRGWYPCGKVNLGDARYCEYCGAPTRLTELGLLMTWEEVVQTYGEIAAGLEPQPEGKEEPKEAPFEVPF
jgi:uncharacterized OB-fold protein